MPKICEYKQCNEVVSKNLDSGKKKRPYLYKKQRFCCRSCRSKHTSENIELFVQKPLPPMPERSICDSWLYAPRMLIGLKGYE